MESGLLLRCNDKSLFLFALAELLAKSDDAIEVDRVGKLLPEDVGPL